MSDRAHEREVEDALVASRSSLTAEERAAGSEDPQTQAEVILQEAEERARERELAPTTAGERRRSEETVEPDAVPGAPATGQAR